MWPGEIIMPSVSNLWPIVGKGFLLNYALFWYFPREWLLPNKRKREITSWLLLLHEGCACVWNHKRCVLLLLCSDVSWRSSDWPDIRQQISGHQRVLGCSDRRKVRRKNEEWKNEKWKNERHSIQYDQVSPANRIGIPKIVDLWMINFIEFIFLWTFVFINKHSNIYISGR